MARDRAGQEQLQQALREAARFYRRPYVTGLGIGEPCKDGCCQEDKVAICVHVEEKLPEDLLRKHQVFPRSVEGVRLDVEQRNFGLRSLSDEELVARQIFPADPASPGVEVGIDGGTAGTLGLIVYDRTDGSPCLLSAAHVLAGRRRTTVYQPGIGNSELPIGSIRRSRRNRKADAAIAVLDRNLRIDAVPLGGRPITGVRRVREGDVLEKSGRTTGVTRAKVKTIGKFTVNYGTRQNPVYEDIMGFELRPLNPSDGEISDGGDSGAVWYDPETGEAVGLTVAGDGPLYLDTDEWTLCCHVDEVFHQLTISLDPEDLIG